MQVEPTTGNARVIASPWRRVRWLNRQSPVEACESMPLALRRSCSGCETKRACETYSWLLATVDELRQLRDSEEEAFQDEATDAIRSSREDAAAQERNCRCTPRLKADFLAKRTGAAKRPPRDWAACFGLFVDVMGALATSRTTSAMPTCRVSLSLCT